MTNEAPTPDEVGSAIDRLLSAAVRKSTQTYQYFSDAAAIRAYIAALEHKHDDLVTRCVQAESDRDALEARLVDAQSTVTAWQCVFETIEAHLLDRIDMKDQSKPDRYLEIIKADCAKVLITSKQISAARWADYARQSEQIKSLEAENKRLREGLEELVRLGGSNGEYGNSIGNQIAKASLAQTGEKSCKKCGGDGYDHGICEGLRLPMSEAELEREAFQLAVDIWECGAERDRKNDTDKCKQWIVELTKKYRGK